MSKNKAEAYSTLYNLWTNNGDCTKEVRIQVDIIVTQLCNLYSTDQIDEIIDHVKSEQQ